MSIQVDVENIAQALADFDTAYLLSVGATGVKVVNVQVVAAGHDLLIPTESGGTARNIAGNPAVTVLCPPRQAGGYSLIIDGAGAADGPGFRVSPTRAVLHRPAAPDAPVPDDPTVCGNDCKSLT